MFRRLLLAFLGFAALSAAADTGVNDMSKQQAFTVSASVVAGCSLGTSMDEPSSFGTVNFGQNATLPSDVDATSVLSGGSIAFQCTPNTPVLIKLGTGANASSVASGRNMKLGSNLLSYQLFQNAARSQVWGDGTNGAPAMSLTATGAVQVLPVYARLFAQAVPPPGVYTDTVVVTVTY